jgi:Tol biopolymer transport system component/DNA-binding winged helix-turn-helix (wHTH) protein
MSHPSQERVRFGPFQVDLHTREVWRDGAPVKLVGQPFEILAVLITQSGKLVSRDELRARLWPEDTFVDFDHGLNAAVNKLREALRDSAEKPTYIQTLPRLGYRFIAPLSAPAEERSGQNERPARAWWKIAVLAVGVLLLGGFGSYLMRSRRITDARLDELKAVPLTTYPGVELAPTFSPDGHLVAFERHEESTPGEADLYVKQVGQEQAVRLTNHKAGFLEPAWSPDGRTIAFVMLDKGVVGVYVIPSVGGPERRLAVVEQGGYPWSLLSWSADSHWVAFARLSPESKHHQIDEVNVETAEERVFPFPSPDCAMTVNPAFSPDGRLLASDCILSGGGHRIYLQPADGSPEKIMLVASPAWVDVLNWTPDSQFLVYSGSGKLWRIAASGGEPEVLSFAHDAMGAAVSLKGNKLAYVQCNTYHSEIWSVAVGPSGTKRAAQKLITSSRGQRNPRYSPDGHHIAFESDRSGTQEIWLADGDGSQPVQLSSLGQVSGLPRWSPDSQKIVFESHASGRVELYTVSISGERPRPLATGTANAGGPMWSSDGKWIYFTSDHPWSLWKVASEGGTAVRLTKEGRTNPQEAADGKRIFYEVQANPTEIWSMPAGGGEERREVLMPPAARAWTPGQNGIYFIHGTQTNDFISFYDFSSRGMRRVAEVPHLAELHGGIAISPDGSRLLYSGLERSESDIMLVENFH